MPSGRGERPNWRTSSILVVDDEDSVAVQSARKIGENESRFRAANEKIEAVRLRTSSDVITVPFVCECGRPDCLQTIRLTIAEYEFARSQNTYFVCLPGHEITAGGVGRVVRVAKTHVIVQKTGAAGEAARQRDPRAEEEERTG